MLHPSIQELLKATEKNGETRLNKYSLVMATAKCARIITNEYLRERQMAETLISNKETDRDLMSLINKEYRDEKAVKNAVRNIKNGEFEILLPGDEGYEDSAIVVEQYNNEYEKESAKYIRNPFKAEVKEDDNILADEATESEEIYDEEFDDSEDEDDFDSENLMGAEEVFNDDSGYIIGENV